VFRKFGDFGQHDAHELLASVLDGLHEDLNQSAESHGNLPKRNNSSDADAWDVHLARNASPILDMFHGCFGSSIECPECGYRRIVRDPFAILSLPIPTSNGKAVDLNQCLEAFCEKETLDRGNLWHCEKCHRDVQASKRTRIQSCPPILIVHLKRFEGSGWHAKKKATPISYPDFIDVDLVTGSHNGPKYELIGAVFHNGTITAGHYTAAALDQKQKQWYSYNDSRATMIDKTQAHSSSAYILFYQKRK
jgi:ubiquitin C-terminal hydrolase